jgi:hypothetical protein
MDTPAPSIPPPPEGMHLVRQTSHTATPLETIRDQRSRCHRKQGYAPVCGPNPRRRVSWWPQPPPAAVSTASVIRPYRISNHHNHPQANSPPPPPPRVTPSPRGGYPPKVGAGPGGAVTPTSHFALPTSYFKKWEPRCWHLRDQHRGKGRGRREEGARGGKRE